MTDKMAEKKEAKNETKKLKADKPKEKIAKAAKNEKKQKQEKIVADAKAVADAFDVIRFVLMTEKSVRLVESQNKLVFIVNRSSRKKEIRNAVQAAFESPVSDVKTVIDQDGRKKAFVKFSNPGAAGDIAIKLGII